MRKKLHGCDSAGMCRAVHTSRWSNSALEPSGKGTMLVLARRSLGVAMWAIERGARKVPCFFWYEALEVAPLRLSGEFRSWL